MADARAIVEDWVLENEELLEAVIKQSVQNLVIEMQTTRFNGGLNRIDQGWHIASFQINLNGEAQAPAREAPEGRAPGWAVSEVGLVINSFRLGDRITGSYGMIYSNRLEYGFTGMDSKGRAYNTPAYGFVRSAAANWPSIVAAVVNEVRP